MQSTKTDESREAEEKPEVSEEEILRLAHKRFAQCEDAESDNRKAALEDIEFVAGEQWDEADVRARKARKRPILTINKLAGFVRQVENDNRQNKQGAKVSPVDDKADVDTAKIIQGMIRHIEYDSNADVAYERMFSGQVRGGFGFTRITTEFESPTSFNL